MRAHLSLRVKRTREVVLTDAPKSLISKRDKLRGKQPHPCLAPTGSSCEPLAPVLSDLIAEAVAVPKVKTLEDISIQVPVLALRNGHLW